MANLTLITIGDEILIGQIVDTNSAYIGAACSQRGFKVVGIHSVGDNPEDIVRAIESAFESSDIVITTGGLGPTKDDITKRTLAQHFGVELCRHEETYHRVKAMLESRGVEFNALNESQADIPQGFIALANPLGTAPGLYHSFRDEGGSLKMLFCLAGVPFEMKALLMEEVLPIMCSEWEVESYHRRTIVIYGLPESELASRIEVWEAALKSNGMTLAYLPNPSGIRLRVSGGVESDVERAVGELRGLLPEYYLGEEGCSIVGEVARLLGESGQRLVVAESCSGGAISAKCTSMSGASGWFNGGVVAYDNGVKVGVLGVDRELIERYGAVSSEVVEAMAQGALRTMGGDYAIATSGIAGPTGGGSGKEIGDVFIALARSGGKTTVWRRNFGQPREVFVERLTAYALNRLRLELILKG